MPHDLSCDARFMPCVAVNISYSPHTLMNTYHIQLSDCIGPLHDSVFKLLECISSTCTRYLHESPSLVLHRPMWGLFSPIPQEVLLKGYQTLTFNTFSIYLKEYGK